MTAGVVSPIPDRIYRHLVFDSRVRKSDSTRDQFLYSFLIRAQVGRMTFAETCRRINVVRVPTAVSDTFVYSRLWFFTRVISTT